MPRETQIIPQYTYPHEAVYINDNSAVDLTETESADLSLKYLAVFAGPRGRDNKLIYITSLATYRTMFGKSDYATYGQPHLMPEAYLSNTDVGVWCLRVMPDDATYSNSVLSLWYKKDVENGAFRIKFTSKSIGPDDIAKLGEEYADALTDRDALIEVGAMLDGTAVDGEYVDEEGYTQVPLAVFTAAGRGVYGQNLRWRITSNQDYEKEYGAKFFTFEVLDVTNSVTVAQTTPATLVPNPNFDYTTFINDVIEDMDDVKSVMDIHVFDDNIEALYNTYVAFCNEMLEEDPTLSITIPDIYTFDPLFGKNLKVQSSKNPSSQPFIKFTAVASADVDPDADGYVAGDYTNTAIVTIDNVAGNILRYGDDGAFADPDSAKRQEAIDEMYIRAFSGDVDKLILSCRRIPASTLFDANYSMSVKLALVRLALFRMDALLYLDTGFRESLGITDIKTLETDFTEIDELVEDFDNISESWEISVNTHDYYIRESSTGKRVRVTISYYLALTDPVYLRQNSDTPIQRTGSYATLSGHVKNSLSPAVDESDRDIKQALSDARINFFESVGENQFERATDHTFIKSTSDLGVEGHVISLFDLKRNMENEFRQYRNANTSPERRKDIKDYLVTKYEYLVGTSFASLDIKYKANEYESARNITHAYLAVTYSPRGEITLIEIDVNQKQYQADTDDDDEE